MARIGLWALILTLAVTACAPGTDEQITETVELREYSPESSGTFGSLIGSPIVAPPGVNMPALEVATPRCQETPGRALTCTGWIANPTEISYGLITLQLDLLDESHQTLASQSATIIRDWLPAGLGSPYRLIFSEIPQVRFTPRLTVTKATPISESSALVALDVKDIVIEQAADQIKISGVVVSDYVGRVEPVRVLITVLKNELAITYRIFELDRMQGQSSQPFDIHVAVPEADYTHVEISVDGYWR